MVQQPRVYSNGSRIRQKTDAFGLWGSTRCEEVSLQREFTQCQPIYTLLAYFRLVNAYDSLDGLFAEIKDELIEKNVAKRLWELSLKRPVNR